MTADPQDQEIWIHSPGHLEAIGPANTLRLLLEDRAREADRRLNDQLLKELIMKYVRAEQHLHQLNEEKNRFLGMAAHDLRNPLASILGMCQLLLESPLDDAIKLEFLESIHHVSKQMLSLVNDLLDVSMIESGRFTLEPNLDRLDTMVAERVRLANFTAQHKGITVSLRHVEEITLFMDRAHLVQVVDNLLTNAIKFSPPETHVEVSVCLGNAEAVVAVRDQGPGIPEQELSRIFGRFQRLQNRPTAGEKSTGLGLAIAQCIVLAHNGTIQISSSPGRGSTFFIHLPLTEPTLPPGS